MEELQSYTADFQEQIGIARMYRHLLYDDYGNEYFITHQTPFALSLEDASAYQPIEPYDTYLVHLIYYAIIDPQRGVGFNYIGIYEHLLHEPFFHQRKPSHIAEELAYHIYRGRLAIYRTDITPAPHPRLLHT